MVAIPRTVRSSLVESLREEILLGKIVPGQTLRLEEIARRFDVSTTPVREALRDLADEGLVTVFPRRGAVVARLSSEDLQEIYEIRATLEAMAARLAVPQVTQATLDRLGSLLEQMDNHPGELVALVRLNHEFHLTLYNASGRGHLCELIRTLRYRTQHYLHAYISDLGGMPRAQIEHRDILDACRGGDAEQAAKVTHEHVINVGRALMEFARQPEGSATLSQD